MSMNELNIIHQAINANCFLGLQAMQNNDIKKQSFDKYVWSWQQQAKLRDKENQEV